MAVLTARSLMTGYQPNRPVSDNLDLTLLAGELVCLLGPNGAGKSTLLRTLAGMQSPLKGEVCLLGDPLHQLSSRTLARRLSLVLSEPLRVGLLSAYEVVALGRQPYTDWWGTLGARDDRIVRWALDAVGAAAWSDRPVDCLSDGERQRVAIARALAQEPALLLLDEPTAHLDVPGRVEIIQLLQRLARQTGRAIVLSTHDLELALRSADTIWLLAEGCTHVGAPEDLVLTGAIARAFERQGICFEPQAGTFSFQGPIRGTVALHGEGLVALWTQRALKRVGYEVTTTADTAPFSVRVRAIGDRYDWILDLGESSVRFDALAPLLRVLAEKSV